MSVLRRRAYTMAAMRRVGLCYRCLVRSGGPSSFGEGPASLLHGAKPSSAAVSDSSGYNRSPALAGIVGARRERTALITSVLSIPWR
jgi:hypothetical protein